MFGILCEGHLDRVTCEPCVSYDDLKVMAIDCCGEPSEKILCANCRAKMLTYDHQPW